MTTCTQVRDADAGAFSILITRFAMPESVLRELASVSTVLTPNERIRVDAAGEGSYRTLHRESVEDVIHDLKLNRAQVVLFSVARCDQRSRAVVARVVREFPRVPTFALLTEVDRGSPHAMLLLGQSGVRQLVDVRDPAGWRELRALLLSARGNDIQRHALGQIALDLTGAPPDCLAFFEALF